MSTLTDQPAPADPADPAAAATALSATSSGLRLRQRAEAAFREQTAQLPADRTALSPEATQRLLHELQVHQVELEMQNEELRQSQMAMDTARIRYFDLYDLAPVGYLTISEKGLIRETNLTAATLLGVGRSALVQQPFTRFILPADQDIFYLCRRQLSNTGTSQVCELRLVRADGQTFWAHLAATVAPDATGANECRVTLTDITARQQAEAALRDANWRMASIIEGTRVGTWEWNIQTGEAVFNPVWAEIIGYTLEELAPINIQTWGTYVHPEDGTRSAQLLERHFAGELPYYDCECRMKHKAGHWVWVHDRGRVITRTSDGQPLMMFGTHTDITVRKQAEAALREGLGQVSHLNEILRATRDIASLFVRERDRRKLLESVCQSLCHIRGYLLVWIGQQDEALGEVKPVAHGGAHGNFPIPVPIRWDDSALGQGPTGIALRERRSVVFPDLAADPRFAPWRDPVLATGAASLISVPMLHQNCLLGVLSVAAGRVNAFDAEEVSFLEDLAGKLAHALRGLEDEAGRQQAEKTLRLTQFSVDSSSESIAWIRPDASYAYVNDAVCRLLGYTREEFLSKTVPDFNPNVTLESWRESWERLKQQGSLTCEGHLVARSGRRVPVEFTLTYLAFEGREYGFGFAHDVTGRKQAEAELRKSEQEFRTLAETVPQMVWATRSDGWAIYFNPQWVDYTGLTREESYGHGWSVPFHPDDRQRAWEAWQRATQQDQPYSQECRLRRADGVYRWWLIRGQPMRSASGEILKWFGTCTDIEEIKQAEQAQRTSAGRLRMFYESGLVGILSWHSDGRITGVNDRYLQMVGYSREDVAAGRLNWVQMTPPEYMPLDQRALEELKATGIATTYEKEYIRQDGSRIAVIIGGATVNEARTEGVAFALDITDRKQAEEALRQSEARLALALDSGQMGLWEWCPPLDQSVWNAKEYELLGLPVGDGRPSAGMFFRHVHPEDAAALKASLAVSLKHAGDWAHEFRILRADGHVRWLAGAGRFLRIPNEPDRMVGLNYDITERKAAEAVLARGKKELEVLVAQRTAQLEQTNRDLQQENQHRKLLEQRLLAAVDLERQRLGRELHDGLSQLLTGAKFKIGLLQRKAAKGTLEPAELGILEQEVNRALEQARAIASGLNPVELLAQELGSALAELADTVQATFSLRCECQCSDAATIADPAAAQHLYRIAQEAIHNAVKHAKAQTIRIQLQAQGDCILLVVQDDGVGILPARLRGAGMGLENMKARAELIGGSLEIQPRPEGGTTVTCTVPRPLEPPAHA